MVKAIKATMLAVIASTFVFGVLMVVYFSWSMESITANNLVPAGNSAAENNILEQSSMSAESIIVFVLFVIRGFPVAFLGCAFLGVPANALLRKWRFICLGSYLFMGLILGMCLTILILVFCFHHFQSAASKLVPLVVACAIVCSLVAALSFWIVIRPDKQQIAVS